ncbi:MAG: cupin domain-containing protein [Gemmatimonadaceae bacterium]
MTALSPGEGERISYCVFPLTITAKIDSDVAPTARLTAAYGALRKGTESATHAGDDEVVFVVHGRGQAFVGSDTVAVEAGSVVFTPRGRRHGFINDGNDVLEYFIVFSEPGPRAAFRRFAARPGPYCPPSPG